MQTNRKLITFTITLGVLSLIALVFSHLALTDIAHGEEDLSMEWNILRVSALIIVSFVGSTFYTLWRTNRTT